VVDIKELFEITQLPVISITKNKPCIPKIIRAIEKIEKPEKRIKSIQNAGKIIETQTKDNKKVYVHKAGISEEETKKVVLISCNRSSIPEPLRVAHMIASSLSNFLRPK
jgi:endonuclease V-like protein UPF0215 family